MAKKPTYEELEKRIQQLEQAESHRKLEIIFDNIKDPQMLWRIEPNGDYTLEKVNKSYVEKTNAYDLNL